MRPPQDRQVGVFSKGLHLVCMQMVPAISISNGQPAMAPPLIFVVLVSMIKDAYEDVNRHIEDSKENNEETQKFDPTTGKFEPC